MAADPDRWRVHPGWSKNSELVYLQQKKNEYRARELYVQLDGDHNAMLEALAAELGWTVPEAYIFTDKMFPMQDNGN